MSPTGRSPLSQLVGSKQKRCAFLFARVGFLSHRAERLPLLGEVVANLIRVGKDHQATIDQVALGTVCLHWGLLGSAAGAALKAATAALQMLEVLGTVPPAQRSSLRLQISVSYGPLASGTVKAAGHSFFVVGGADVDIATRVVNDAIPDRMACNILITEAVRQEVQYHMACSPRLWFADTLWFQPTHLRKGDQNDEWMYELQQQGRQDGAIADTLLELLKKMRSGKSSVALRSEINAVRERFGAQLSAADSMTLSFLSGGFQARLKGMPSQPALIGLELNQRGAAHTDITLAQTPPSCAAQRWATLASRNKSSCSSWELKSLP
eukprot:GGOE01013194.1.p1 GENE.GGOE01013194.1~~GGOE01013194.1.p1  ORF type:complete len:377 (+),score=71.26 GGOE01013194.1:160-1131(+)